MSTPLNSNGKGYKYGAIDNKEALEDYAELDGPVCAPGEAGYQCASVYSQLVFGWITPLLQLGNEKEQLDPSDLVTLPLPDSCRTGHISYTFDKYWQEEITRTNAKIAEMEQAEAQEQSTETAAAAKTKSKKKKKYKPRPSPSLARTLFRAFGRDFVRAGFLKLCHDLLIFVGPQVLNGLIQFLRDKEAPQRRGLELTAAVTLSQLLMSFTLRHYFFRCYLVGLRVRSAVVMAVYRKALVLEASERQTRSTGEITNLISVDAQRLQDLITYLHAVWYSGMQILLALYFLWQQLGPSCLGGVAVIIIMMPVTKKVSLFMRSRQRSLMKAKDERVDINNEVLGSMKVIKFQAWEASFQKKIEELRGAELHELLKYVLANSLTIMLWSAVPLLVALASFAAFVWTGHFLDVAVALTSLALFEILRFPLFMLPQVINNIVEASVSLQRVQSFLMCQDHQPVGVGELAEDGSILIDHGSYVYDSKRPKVEDLGGSKADRATAKRVADYKWEVMLLKAQLMDAEMQIKNMVKEGHPPASVQTNCSPENIIASKNLISLRRVNLDTKRELIAVVGAVGTGKSTLINGILGEVRQLRGSTNVRGRLAYFAQTPFIMNDTVKANVIFGRQDEPFNEERYRAAISVCALKHDLTLLPNGDMCEIGEKGITLSGGQKARVAMARAVYHDADIYLLDDPLAAVDAHVGKHIFRHCIVNKMLYGKGVSGSSDKEGEEEKVKKSTVILVTNALQYLSHPAVDQILVMNNGFIQERGTYSELTKDQTSLFSTFMKSYQESLQGDDVDVMSMKFASQTSLSALADLPDEPEVSKILSPKQQSGVTIRYTRQKSETFEKEESKRRMSEKIEANTNTRTTTDEFKERETGHVSLAVYLAWCRAAGSAWTGVFVLLSYAAVEGVNVLSRWWLTYWSLHGDEVGNQTGFLAIYALINLASVLAAFGRLVFVMFCSLRASRKLFDRLLDAVLRAKMSFFDTTPVGRIVNRFSKDMYTVDEQLIATIRSYLATVMSVVGVIVVISSVTPLFTLFLIPMIIFYGMQQNFFTKSYRELKRLDSVSRSPLYALLGETLDGISTIRAYSAQNSLVRRISGILNRQQNAYFLTVTAQCFLAVRLELVGTLIIAFACLCSVFEHRTRGGDDQFASLAGLSISFSLSVTQALNWSVRMGSDLEANMIAVERVEQYCNVPSEAPRELENDAQVKKTWPGKGEIVFKNAKMRYRPGLPLVLKGLDLVIPAQSKVGVVGRTGAGKSTLMVALLRIVELDSGSIMIDGVDISTLGLSLLRSNIAVIPQDPVLFTGTVRTNVDPFNEYGEQRLYEVLSRVGLTAPTDEADAGPVGSIAVKSLEDTVYEGGTNFSVGQRQLLVIARALLQEATIVIMDEATAAVDAETDSRIQRVMRTEFDQATCITVAHRVNTIMDSDLILFMEDGRVAEFDSPGSLLVKGGKFQELVDAWDEEHKQ